jgi:hypothetical protein
MFSTDSVLEPFFFFDEHSFHYENASKKTEVGF